MTGMLKTTSLDYRQHYVIQCIYTRTNEEHIKDKKFQSNVFTFESFNKNVRFVSTQKYDLWFRNNE